MRNLASTQDEEAVTVPVTDAEATPSFVDEATVARRAFELYCARGGADGHDLDDWLSAERELRTASDASAARPDRE
jgi:hypothetical protein